MSKRRGTSWVRQPLGVVAVVPVILAGSLIGCSAGFMTLSHGRSGHQARASEAADSGPSAGARVRPRGLAGRAWLAEGPKGWEAGTIGGGAVPLGRAEVGIAASGGWIVSANLQRTDAIRLLVRGGPGAHPSEVQLGGLAPTATAIVGDHAYVSGFSFGDPTDPGILRVDLATGASETVLASSGAPGTRYLAVSADESTLVSSLCDQAAHPEPETCALTAVSLGDGAVTGLGNVRGGILRATSPEVAIVGPASHEAPDWLAGIDLRTGRELWTVKGGELGPSVLTAGAGLIQQHLRTDGATPRLVIEAIDLGTGATRIVYQEKRLFGRSLWPALCSDDFIVIGDDATGRRALAGSIDGHARVRIVPLDGTDPFDLPVTLRTRP